MADRSTYTAEFELRVKTLYKEGCTAKPMLDILQSEFPQYPLTYSKLQAYIAVRQEELTELKRRHEELMEQYQTQNSLDTAKRIHKLEQGILESLEKEVERCKVGLTTFDPWSNEYTKCNNAMCKMLEKIEKYGRTAMVRKVEESAAVAKVKEDAKGDRDRDPLLEAASASGGVI